MWNPTEHSKDENFRWCHLRAIEWGGWPAFISQPIAPFLILLTNWQVALVVTVLANVMWARFVRYNIVILSLAYWGIAFVRLRWVACPVAAYVLYTRGERVRAAFALFWPLMATVIAAIPPSKVGRIEQMFLHGLGYRSVLEGNAPT
jgi:hypothetical protein